jgi:hypothetical protein
MSETNEPSVDERAVTVLASLTWRERRGVDTVVHAMEHWDAAVTGRRFLRETARRLVAKGVLEEMGCYRVDDYDNLTDRWGIGYRLTEGLGFAIRRLIHLEEAKRMAELRAEMRAQNADLTTETA